MYGGKILINLQVFLGWDYLWVCEESQEPLPWGGVHTRILCGGGWFLNGVA